MRLVKAVPQAIRMRPGMPAGHVTNESDSEGLVVVHARSSPDYLGQLREELAGRTERASMLGLIVGKFLHSLQSNGIAPSNYVNFMVDLNRHLPEGHGTLANFIAVSPVAIQPPFDASPISAGLVDEATSGRAFARYGLSSLARVVRRGGALRKRRCTERLADVVVSDHRLPEVTRKTRWAGDTDRLFLVMMPASPDRQLSFALAAVGDQLLLSACFFPEVFDEAAVQAAIDETAGVTRA
jgi:hypothetical protein